MSENRLFIRADGNSETGLGHIMRCLSIADGLAGLGVQTVFLTADGRPEDLIRGRGYGVQVLDTDYRQMEGELPVLRDKIKENGIPFLLIDSYFAGKEYLEAVSGLVRTGCLDDFGRERLPVDLIINYNIYAQSLPYGDLYRDGVRPARLLLGAGYAPLRAAFGSTPYTVRPKAEKVLVTTGGADAYHAAARFVEAMLKDSRGRDSVYHVVSGPFHTGREELLELGRAHENVHIHENVTRMAELMAECDVAVSAAGSTLYELCALGVPTVYFYFVENQELPGRYFGEATDMINAGNFAGDAEDTLRHMTDGVYRLLESYGERRRISVSMKKVTDGRGAERTAECLKSYIQGTTG